MSKLLLWPAVCHSVVQSSYLTYLLAMVGVSLSLSALLSPVLLQNLLLLLVWFLQWCPSCFTKCCDNCSDSQRGCLLVRLTLPVFWVLFSSASVPWRKGMLRVPDPAWQCSMGRAMGSTKTCSVLIRDRYQGSPPRSCTQPAHALRTLCAWCWAEGVNVGKGLQTCSEVTLKLQK